ncbi:MAG TPA: ribbon-helix-helix protein, CopG family [Anaerolineae bacterium]|nr:ribbon-helix-helix protein, CopG family [Anaerolineae bacterium]
MIQTQVELTEEQARRLQEIAERNQIPISEVVQRAVEHWLKLYGDIPIEERQRRALAVVGRFHGGRGDIARNHNNYVAESINDYEPSDNLP